ncbi:MAG: glycosyltransferase [bacterium]
MNFDFSHVYHLTRHEWIVLLLPALLFDTTRYYLTNTVYFFLRLIPRFRRKEDRGKGKEPFYPTVTVLVPVYNEGTHLQKVLDAVLGNEYPDFEVIVVDDASTDETWKLCRRYQEEGKIRYLRKKIRGSKPSSINYGLLFARGELVMLMDGDTLLDKEAIFQMVQPFRDSKVGGVSGNLAISNAGKNLLTLLQSAEFSMTIGIQRRWLSLTDMLQIASGAFSVFRKSVLHSLRGVDPEYGEDLDITLKTRKMGYDVVFAPKALAYTDMPTTLGGIFRQRLRWDRCYIRINLRKHGNMIRIGRFRFTESLSIVLDFLFNLLLLFLFPLYVTWVAVFIPQMTWFVLIVTYIFYTLANVEQLLISAWLSKYEGPRFRWLLTVPFLFPYFLYLRAIRAFAYLLEIVRSGRFQSQFFPEAVRKQIPRY